MVKPQQELKKRHLTQKQHKLHNFRYGHSGEQIAIVFLNKIGYTILSTNVRLQNNEVDIVALDTTHHELVFVEVKRKHTAVYGNPAHAVTLKKMKHMAVVARKYQQKYRYSLDIRFDTISIVGNSIEHFKNISWSARSF